MPSTVYYIPLESKETVESIATKSAKIFTKSGLDKIYKKDDMVAVKQHFGENAKGNFIKPQVTAEFVTAIKNRQAKPFLTETSTLYVGNRSDGIAHAQTVHEHGFTLDAVGAPFIPADGVRGVESSAVKIGAKHFKEVQIAQAIYHADSVLVLTHITGHCEAGYGGAIKNIAMGAVPRSAKMLQHFGAIPKQNHAKCNACGACIKWCPSGAIELVGSHAKINEKQCIGCGECLAFCKRGAMNFDWSGSGKPFIEKLVEHAYGFVKIKSEKTAYINYAVDITTSCDCLGYEKPKLGAIGILASTDLLACEQATIDLINKHAGCDLFDKFWPGYEYQIQLTYGEKLGLGDRNYKLVEL